MAFPEWCTKRDGRRTPRLRRNPPQDDIYLRDPGSPSDSGEERTSYVRGAAGLSETLEKIRDATLGRQSYVGEWHSHGRSSSAAPSRDDLTAIKLLAEELGGEGLPIVMVIKADGAERVLVEQAGA